MSRVVVRSLALLTTALALGSAAAHPFTQVEERPGATVPYRIEQLAETGRDLTARFTPSQLGILEKLNRADLTHLRRLEYLVVPLAWLDEDLRYSPFPVRYPAAFAVAKLLVVHQPAQAFAAYEHGRLVRWGPVSSGRRTQPTPRGLFHLNWRSRGRHSTVDPDWYMEWYFNFDNAGGLALHSYALPGYPASHACVRLLERDAIWIYEWGDATGPGAGGQDTRPGTPVWIIGQYAFGAPPPWRTLEHLSLGIDLPEALPPDLASGVNP